MEVDNPVYDPDGDESVFTNVPVDNNKDQAPPVHSAPSDQVLILKEKPYDKKSLPHQVKFVRRKKVTRQCVIIILLLTLILIGLGIGIYFVAVKGSSQLVSKDYDTQEVEGQFRIVNRNYVAPLSDPKKPDFWNMSHDLRQLIIGVFQSSGDNTVLVSDVIVIGFRPGSVVVLFKVILDKPYNATFAEKELHELFISHAKATEDYRLELGDYLVDRITLHFNALPVTHTNGKTRSNSTDLRNSSVLVATGSTSSARTSTTPTISGSSGWHHQSVSNMQGSTTPAVPQCQPITIEFCKNTSQVPYNKSFFPNWLGHSSQEAARVALWQFRGMIQNKCHPYIRRFICATLVPSCVQRRLGIFKLPPCRQLCYEVLSRCTSDLYSRVNIINCEDLPDSDDPNICVGAPAIQKYPLRLVGGLGPKEGHVEVYYNGSWGKICDTHWDEKDADVVCRQLKLGGKSKAYRNSYFGVNFMKTHLRDIRCSGHEKHIALCNMVVGSLTWCDEEHSAGVICDYDNRNVSLPVRLHGGTIQSSGRLEVFYNNTWGTVCDDDFGDTEAMVVCHMIGYKYTGQVKSQTQVQEVMPATGPIWLSSLRCSGDETSLVMCEHSGWGIDMCDHDEDVYIDCEQEPPDHVNKSQNVEAEFRLVDGNQYSGRIEVKHNNIWGTVCRHLFNNITAAVFCRTLNLSDKNATYEFNRYGRGTGPIWLDGLYCTGSEQTILDCKHQGWGIAEGCSHINDVSISCPPELDPNTTLFYNYDNGSAYNLSTESFLYNVDNITTTPAATTAAITEDLYGTFITCLIADKNCTLVDGTCALVVGKCLPVNGSFTRVGGNCTVEGRLCMLMGGNCTFVDADCTVVDGNCTIMDETCTLRDGNCTLVGGKCMVLDGNHTLVGGNCTVVDGNCTFPVGNCTFVDANCTVVGGNCTMEGRNCMLVGGNCTFVDANCTVVDGNCTMEGRICMLVGGNCTLMDETCTLRDGNCTLMGGKCIVLDGTCTLMDGNCTMEGRICMVVGENCTLMDEDCTLRDGNCTLVCSNCSVVDNNCTLGDWMCRMVDEPCIVDNANYSVMELNDTAVNRNCSDGDRCILSDVVDPGIEVVTKEYITSTVVMEYDTSTVIYTTESPPEKLVRLLGGDTPSAGRIEVYYSGHWGTVCSHGFGNATATVVCRMLGYTGTGQYLINNQLDVSTNQPIVMDHVDCIGDEKTIFDCNYWPEEEITCSHDLDAVITCRNEIEVYNVRLFGGEHAQEGFVEVLKDGVWGTVCKKGFGEPEASVTCNMMGYRGHVQVLNQMVLDNQHHMLLSGVSCKGNEPSLFDCIYTDDKGDCDDWEDHVYIVCDAAEQTPLRIVPLDDSVPNRGRVEVEIGGKWGTICNFDTSKQTVLVLCRGIGYKNLTEERVSAIQEEQAGEGPIWLSELECYGSETDIRHCAHKGRHHSELSCDHDEDLVIQCG